MMQEFSRRTDWNLEKTAYAAALERSARGWEANFRFDRFKSDDVWI